MESHPIEHLLNVKKPQSSALNSDENEASTANSLLSIERLYVTSPTADLKPSEPTIPISQPLLEVNNEVPAAPPQIKCLYCDESCHKSQIAEHQENCEKRKIQCEACGEMVMLDIFDFHIETCTHRTDNIHGLYMAQNIDYFLQMNGINLPEPDSAAQPESWQGEENVEDQDGEPVSDSYEEEEEEFDPNTLTYEQLITLDNTIVKKGMTDEEMENFPIDVHVNEFDGPFSCTVCISEVENGEVTRKLNCGHKFHKDCIDTWLSQNITCPICKKFLR